jgi:hypothetical protein
MSLAPVPSTPPQGLLGSVYEPNNSSNVYAAERKKEMQEFLVQSSFKSYTTGTE